MGRVPRIALASAAAVVMPEHRAASAMARPSPARRIAPCEQRAVGIAAGEDVVPRRPHLRARLGERRVPREVDAVAVQLFDAGRNLHSVRIDPRTSTDPVARVNGRPIGRGGCAEIRTPPSIAASNRSSRARS